MTINYDAMVRAIRSKFSQPKCRLVLTANLVREGNVKPVSLQLTPAPNQQPVLFHLDKSVDLQQFNDLPTTMTVGEMIAPIEVYMPAHYRELNRHLALLDTTIELPSDQLLRSKLGNTDIKDIAALGAIPIKVGVIVPTINYRARTLPNNSIPFTCLFSPAAVKYIYESGVPSQSYTPLF